MLKKTAKLITVVAIMLLLASSLLYSKSKKNDEKRFQLGAGVNISTANLFGLIHSIKMTTNKDYTSLGLSQQASDELPDNIKQTIMIANIFASMEYAIQLRMLAHAVMIEADLIFLPVDNAASGRFDMLLTVNLGLRAPFWLMPYITAGANFTFSWYPGRVVDIENWRSTYGRNIAENFAWSPGINLKIGLDLKFKQFSAGVYYQYMVKDFNEFSKKFKRVFMDMTNSDSSSAFGMLFGSQSRFGVSVCWYLF